MTSVCEALRKQVEAWRKLGHLCLSDEFVLRNGKPYIAAKYKGARGAVGQCYRNAHELHETRPSLLYVEGYAIRRSILFLPMRHAWLADPKTLEVVDPTWEHPETCDYFGVPFNRDEATKYTLRSGFFSILGVDIANIDLMFERDPPLKAIFEERYPTWQKRKEVKTPAKPSAKSKRSSKGSAKTTASRSSAKSSPRSRSSI